jgi:hypothetical protein
MAVDVELVEGEGRPRQSRSTSIADCRIRNVCCAALTASALSAQAQATDPGVELAFVHAAHDDGYSP